MLGYQESKVSVLRLELRSIKAVAVDRNDTVGILVYDDTVGIHTECSDCILKFSGAVYDLGLIELVRKMREDLCGQLNSDTEVNSV